MDGHILHPLAGEKADQLRRQAVSGTGDELPGSNIGTGAADVFSDGKRLA